jgi:HEAT repeat protein
MVSGCYVDTPATAPEAVSARLATLLRDQNADVRRTAAEALGKIAAQTAGAALIGAVQDKDAGVRAAAAFALGRIGYQEAAPALITLLGDPMPLVREASALALGELDTNKSTEQAVFRVLDSGNGVTRLAATRALLGLSQIHYSPGFAPLLRDGDAAVRQGAVALLGETGDPRAIPHLVERMERDPNSDVRAEAAYRLGKIGGSQVRPLLQRVAERDDSLIVRRWAVWGLDLSTPPPEPDSGR